MGQVYTRRLTLEVPVRTPDGGGGQVRGWEERGAIWADVRMRSGGLKHSEFGRTPFAQGKNGRDHNPQGFSMWLAGGGIKGGTVYGATDEYGYRAIENKLNVNDLHANILHLLGIDHTRLTYQYSSRDFRLTDVGGRVIPDILA